jgi:hypothetical protein
VSNTATSCLRDALNDRLRAAHPNTWRSLPALPFHHAAQDAYKLCRILKLRVVHCFLGAIYILDRAPGDTTRTIVIMHTVPQERAVLQRHGKS